MPLLSETGNRQLAPGWFMAFCRDCTLHHPTRSAQNRDEWAQDHADRTGHIVKRLRSADDGAEALTARRASEEDR